MHCDCLQARYIATHLGTDLLKSVVNSAALNARHTIEFSNLQYQRVAQRYLASINMYISDTYYRGTLSFENEIEYVLHFWQCPTTAPLLSS